MRRAPYPAERWPWLLAWLLLFAVAAWLRLWQIGHQVLIDDEWHAVHKLMHFGYKDIFLSFGHADHTIPLTLLFRTLADTIGLSEWRMRALPLAFGLATVLVLPWVARPWLKRCEPLVFAGLLALSPLLIHFARYVRPYALTVPMGFIAMLALWRWWHERRPAWGWVFVVLATACAWLHPLTLLFTAAGLTWFGLAALVAFWQGDKGQALKRIVPLGALTTLLCSLLVLPPLLADPGAMASKSGIHQVQWLTFVRSWELLIGSANVLVAGFSLVLACLGAWQLWRRDAAFLAYWMFMTTVALVVTVSLDAAWIHHALVLVRYTAVAQPMLLLLIALGLTWLLSRGLDLVMQSVPGWAVAGGAMLWLCALYLAGPLPQVYSGINQFTSHMRYHYDYRFERSIYTTVMAEAELPDVYRRIAAEPGDWVLVETPWHFESHFSPLSEYQREHQLPLRIGMISGLCSEWTHGELRRGSDQHIIFRRFVFLADLLAAPQPENRFVIFHRGTPFGYVRELPDIEPCIDAFRAAHGRPWHEDEEQVVFRIPAG